MQILQSTLSHVFVGVLGAVIALSARAGEANNADILGKWTVVTALDSADVTAIDDKQAKRLVGKPVSISKDSFAFDGRVCRSPTYARTQERTADYFREQMHASTDKLHLPATVTPIDARCTFLFPKADGKLMFLWKGFFFDAQRKKPWQNRR
ncbi:hypothetical protein [Massilia aquatica]|uniref:Lipocalin-like domain-containing protein n=1 Tax=Massilia aquatica TaxID=2609000 RepID=A0ABX0M0Z7_9BURK|nr:hypothetical protein [Massilia aquatica]NHZ39924.1 hypothetical protein [Massilia aquatica]